LVLLIFLGSSLFSQNWKSIVTGFSSNVNEGVSIDIYHSKQYFTGVYEGSLNIGFNSIFGINQNDIFFGKADLSGNTEWLKAINGTGIDRVSNILCIEDKILVSGTFSDSLFVGSDTLVNEYQKSTFIAYFDTLGNYLYTFHPNVFNADIKDFNFDSQGNLLMTGEFWQHFVYGGFSMTENTGLNFFLIKYNPSLDSILWGVKSSGGANLGEQISIDNTDGILVTGSYNDGTYFIDTLLSTGNLNHNMFVVKVDSSGNRDWITTIEGTGEVHGYGIACDDTNNVFVVGEFKGVCDVQSTQHTSNGLFDVIVVKYGENGMRKWSEGLGSTDSDEGYDLVLDENFDPIIMSEAGVDPIYQGQILYTHGFNEPLLLKLKNSDASVIWDQRLYATQTSGQVNAMSFAIEGNYIAMTGVNITGIEFNSVAYNAPNNKDFYSVILEDSLQYHLGLIESEFVSDFLLYPNPSNGRITLESKQNIENLLIFNSIGNLVYKQRVNNTEATVDVHEFDLGVYYIQVKFHGFYETHKLLIID